MKLDDEHIFTGIEQLTCLLYGFGLQLKEVDVSIGQDQTKQVVQTSISGMVSDELSIITAMRYKDTHSAHCESQLLPPCSKVHIQHIVRVNFQVRIWHRALDHF